MKRLPMIAGNWKMNTNVSEAINLVKTMLMILDEIKGIEKVVCPPSISLDAVKNIIKQSSIKLGAQNMYFEEKGAFTGEISPLMLAGLCEYVIIGHSERRQYFNETDDIVNKKMKIAIKNSLKTILCIGEKLDENESGKTEAVLTRQITACSDKNYFTGGAVIAYEPVWAIGTGKAATSSQANDTIAFIRRLVSKQMGSDIGVNVRILYGGSVTANNITDLMKEPEIDGALVGGASLKADDFVNITRQASQIRGSN